jgi:sugar/nucleoside kinase (ribokinase family)
LPATQSSGTMSAGEPGQRIAVFAPHPPLTVTLEREGARHEQVHFHPGGQGVWVARTAASLGAEPVLCGLLGGESGELLGGLLQRQIDHGSAYVPERAFSGVMRVTLHAG